MSGPTLTPPSWLAGPPAIAAYVHNQELASAEWLIEHELGHRPLVQIVDTAGTEVWGGVEHLDEDNVRLTFSSPFSGKAFLL